MYNESSRGFLLRSFRNRKVRWAIGIRTAGNVESYLWGSLRTSGREDNRDETATLQPVLLHIQIGNHSPWLVTNTNDRLICYLLIFTLLPIEITQLISNSMAYSFWIATLHTTYNRNSRLKLHWNPDTPHHVTVELSHNCPATAISHRAAHGKQKQPSIT